MIIISDLHLKEDTSFNIFQNNFLDWLLKKFNDEILIFLGDVFDRHTPHWTIFYQFKSFLAKRNNETYILCGNHDKGYHRGNSLLGLTKISEDIKLIFETKEYIIEDCKCLFIPHKHNIDEYENLEWEGDYCFAHLTPIEEAFGGKDGVKLEKINAYKIYGHIHTSSEGKNYNFLIPGVPLPTRNKETNNPLYSIVDKKIEKIDHPIWFEFENIDYPNLPTNKNNIINVKKAPSIPHVTNMYKDYNIRLEGIELLIDVNNEEQSLDFGLTAIKNKFTRFSEDNEIDKELIETCLSYL